MFLHMFRGSCLPGDNFYIVNFNQALPHDPATNQHVDVQDDHFELVREIGAASVVLLKNVAGALPLRKPKSLAVIGELSVPVFSRFRSMP